MHFLFGNKIFTTLVAHFSHRSTNSKKVGKMQKINPNLSQIHPNRPQILPQSTPERAKIDPKSHPEAISDVERFLNRFFTQIGSALTAQDRPKTTPRPPQDRPKPAQDRPKIGQDRPGAPLGRFLELQVDPSWLPRWLRKR